MREENVHRHDIAEILRGGGYAPQCLPGSYAYNCVGAGVYVRTYIVSTGWSSVHYSLRTYILTFYRLKHAEGLAVQASTVATIVTVTTATVGAVRGTNISLTRTCEPPSVPSIHDLRPTSFLV